MPLQISRFSCPFEPLLLLLSNAHLHLPSNFFQPFSQGSLIFGKGSNKIISGCLEKYPANNKQSRTTVGYIIRNDIENEEIPLTLPDNYLALLFITDKLSSPDDWFM